MLLRRPGIGLYLVATVVLGYLASLGLTDLVFHALHRGPEAWGGLDWTVGFFLFVILVAVGEDYNIFLMARVVEEERKHGVTEGTRRAVAHTGGIISSCGLIMAGTFGAMLTGKLASFASWGSPWGSACCSTPSWSDRSWSPPSWSWSIGPAPAAGASPMQHRSRPWSRRRPTATPAVAP